MANKVIKLGPSSLERKTKGEVSNGEPVVIALDASAQDQSLLVATASGVTAFTEPVTRASLEKLGKTETLQIVSTEESRGRFAALETEGLKVTSIPRAVAIANSFQQTESCLVLSVGLDTTVCSLVHADKVVSQVSDSADFSLKGLCEFWLKARAKMLETLARSNPKIREEIRAALMENARGIERIIPKLPFKPPLNLSDAIGPLETFLKSAAADSDVKSIILSDWAATHNNLRELLSTSYRVLATPPEAAFHQSVLGLLSWSAKQNHRNGNSNLPDQITTSRENVPDISVSQPEERKRDFQNLMTKALTRVGKKESVPKDPVLKSAAPPKLDLVETPVSDAPRKDNVETSEPVNQTRAKHAQTAPPPPKQLPDVLPSPRRHHHDDRVRKMFVNALILIGGILVLLILVIAYVATKGETPPPPLPTPVPSATVKVDPSPAQTPSPTPPPVEDSSMVLVEGGSFEMGRKGLDPFESPAHLVSVNSFYLDKTEVTREAFKVCVDEGKCTAPRDWKDGTYQPGTGDWPVTEVSWYQAKAYADFVQKRLPTEEEWEFAARYKTGSIYPWGNTWIPGNANVDTKSLTRVGSFPPSPLGLFDMAGNAQEWTTSKLMKYPDKTRYVDDVKLESGDPLDNLRVVRGGSYVDDKTAVTTTYRVALLVEREPHYAQTGFRCARSAQ